ncbi:uncharacterized protein LOC133187411 [Saccostrea echinata]|uniref:uncharacterized protein LOC133187411 n=1 Tax=Saccostrea echinata TaxID=191078 RepID=UPI002A80B1B2|nr:uncharacterized protein LOC133187411 [Saccostrea echinata]
MLTVVLIWGLFGLCVTYIVSKWEQPVCPFVKCQNKGILDQTTCQCVCPQHYFGFFCEKTYQNSKWPDGTYALPASMFGCPETEDRGWTSSYINLTLPDSAQRQYWNTKDPNLLNGIIEPNILGPYYYRAIQMNFCVKNRTNDKEFDDKTTAEWPKGQYCIYSFSEICPQGFSTGTLTISGYQFTQQDIGGLIPGETGNNMSLTLKFCCREDGDNQTPVKLPSDFPFVLFQSQSADACQKAESMIVQQDYFYMTNENDEWQYKGALPFLNKTAINGSVGMVYCYYEPFARRECYFDTDFGNSYNGRTNVSKRGKACLSWKKSSFEIYKNSRRVFHEFDENYCRAYQYNTYTAGKPLCIVKLPNWKQFCIIRKCDEDQNLKELGKFRPYRSVQYDENSEAVYAVDGSIDTLNSFISTRPMMKPWYQVNLQEHVEVHAIIIYRFSAYMPFNLRYLGTYVSKNRWDFMNYGAVRCDDIRRPGYALVFRYQCRRPVVGQYVTIRNFDFTHPDHNPGNFFKMEINEIKILGKETTCGRPLGMASGNIYDYQLEASSVDEDGWQTLPLSLRGRLYHPNPGWCAPKTERSPWFMIDLLVPTVVQGLSVQGWMSGKEARYIQSFQVSYGVTRNKITRYEDSTGITKTFNIDDTVAVTTPQTFLFHNEILTRYITIHPIIADGQQACLKAEVIGCQKQLQRDIKCRNGSLDFGFEELKRFSFWLSKEKIHHVFKNISRIEGCRQFCLNNNCTSLSFKKYTSDQECSISFGDRYHPARMFDWVQTGVKLNYASHRLCLKVYPCTFLINLSESDRGIIKSPGFPFSYGQGLNCTWNIYAGDTAFVKLEIVYVHLARTTTEIELNELGMLDINPGKCKDRVVIQDDENLIVITSDSQDKFRDTVVISSGRNVSVSLETCFQMSAMQLEKIFEIKITKSDKPGCGMSLGGRTVRCRMQSAYISTDRHPASYKKGDSFTWKIDGKFGQYVKLTILNLDVVNGGATCSNSYIAIYDTDLNQSQTLIGRFCKENRPFRIITSRWHHMRVEFRSGTDQKPGRGFMGFYELVYFTQNYLSLGHEGCPSVWHYNNGSCYNIFTGDVGITWSEANRHCIQKNGSLVSIASKQELAYVHYLVTNDKSVTADWQIYIGLQKRYSKETDEQKYTWSDGNPLTFTAWFRDGNTKDRQPNGVHNELCTSIKFYNIHSMDDWHDTACAYDKIQSYMCEIDVELFTETISRRNWWGNGSVQLLSARLGNILFQCENTELISKLFVCDGMEDCSDGSDETNCFSSCTDVQFQCADGACISISLYCDFVYHCVDHSDETDCIRRPCTDEEWKCMNDQCISTTDRCDMKIDCLDGSDEKYCDTCTGFECYDQTCLHPSKVCDGFIDCSGFFAEDESQDCENNVQETCKDWWGLGRRENGEYLVSLGYRDIPPANVECRFHKLNKSVIVETFIHHSEEETVYSSLTNVDTQLRYTAHEKQIWKLKKTNKCSQTVRISCHYIYLKDIRWQGKNGQWFYASWGPSTETCSCPFVNKCEEGKTRCNCNSTLDELYSAEITDVKEDAGVITDHSVLPVQKLFINRPGDDRFVKIEIGPLVCTEETMEFSKDFLCRTGKIESLSNRCILDYDVYGDVIGCRDLSHLDDCESMLCPPGYMKCPGSFCIPPRLICDGEKHCKDGVDEMQCESCPGLYRCKNSTVCLNPKRLCDNINHCPLHDDEILCQITCPDECNCDGLSGVCRDLQYTSAINLPVELRLLNLSKNDFSRGLPSMLRLIHLVRLFISNCGLKAVEPYSFANQRNLLELDLGNNKISHLYTNAFTGLVSLKVLNLEGNEFLTEISDSAFVGLQKLPKFDLTNCRMWSIGAGTFAGLRSVNLLNISGNDIQYVSDFAFHNLSEVKVLDIRKNKIQQFSAKIFYGLSKLEKLFTDSYAFCCLKPQTVKLCLPNADEFSSCDDLMRNEFLSTCMWIMGFCSLLGNFGVFIFKVFFDKQTLKKGHGIFITNLSVSDFLMGVYLITIASADTYYRGSYIWNDNQWRHSATCKIAGMLATISSETSVLLLCLITVDRFIAVKFPLGQFRFTRGRALLCIGVLWSTTVVLSTIPLIAGGYFQGEFYSRSAVCLALPLTRDRPAGWEYSTAIFIILNLLLFLIIALGQCLIYREISRSTGSIKSTRKTQDIVIARGLFLVIFTDFICWFPIGIMGLLALRGYVVSGEVYAWVAVFILPINSALNPFLYSFANLRKRVETNMSSKKKTSMQHHSTAETFRVLCDNKLFVIGKHSPVFVSLSNHLQNGIITVPEMKLVVLRLAEALKILHEYDLVHGNLNTDLVLLDVVNMKIEDVYVRTVPKDAEEDEDIPKDIKQLGEITLKMLRNYHKNTSKNTEC